jgi:hypothetical protein
LARSNSAKLEELIGEAQDDMTIEYGDDPLFASTQAQSIVFWIEGGGKIEISIATGEVSLDGLSLSQASVQFWKSLANGYVIAKKDLCRE